MTSLPVVMHSIHSFWEGCICYRSLELLGKLAWKEVLVLHWNWDFVVNSGSSMTSPSGTKHRNWGQERQFSTQLFVEWSLSPCGDSHTVIPPSFARGIGFNNLVGVPPGHNFPMLGFQFVFAPSLWQGANARNVSCTTLYGGQFTL